MTRKNTRFLKVLWLIPIIALGYIGWMNLLPLGSTGTYYIDVGGNDTSGKAIITGPFDRISDKKDVDSISFRELEKNLVYFELEDLRLKDAAEISVLVGFQNKIPASGKLMLGARNKQEWSYDWQDIFVMDERWQSEHKDTLQTSGDDWVTSQANWKRKDIFVSNNKLSFCFDTSFLAKQPDKSIPIDWIEIHFKVLPIWERLKGGS
jgi:hypothetical protein